MTPRPAPDLDHRRALVVDAARVIAEADGWAGVTMRRLASDLGVTQPVLYSAFPSRQAIVDAVAITGFDQLAAILARTRPTAESRARAYLMFAADHPRLYEAMFLLPSGLPFGDPSAPPSLRTAFSLLEQVFPDDTGDSGTTPGTQRPGTTGDVGSTGTARRTGGTGTNAEVAWSLLHGLATLESGHRLRADFREERLLRALDILGRGDH